MSDATGSVDNTLRILKEIAGFVRSLSADDIDRILKGESKLAVVPRSSKPTGDQVPPSAADVERIRTTLLAMNSREEGVAYVESLRLNRNSLQALNSAFDLPVRKTDKVEDLRSNLVEATIGFRLRSHAIREK